LSAAAQDLINAVEYYESQSSGLGQDLLDDYEMTLSKINDFPLAWAPINSHLRRCLIRKFPYAVFYSIENQVIIVSAIADLRMNPEEIKKQLP